MEFRMRTHGGLPHAVAVFVFFIACLCNAGEDATRPSIPSGLPDELVAALERGEAVAQTTLGIRYYNGDGVSQDYAQAAFWFRKVAEQGYAGAQALLGLCYRYGDGVSQDYEQAVSWYRKAAEQGFATAQNSLANLYNNGEGVSRDYEQAVSWYRKAAEQGHAQAQNSLGVLYYDGKGVSRDYEQAVSWYRKAAERGRAAAQNNLGNCYYNGKGVSQDYEQAVSWYRKAAEQGYVAAQKKLASVYDRPYAVSEDEKQAAFWYRKAAEQGDAISQYVLGTYYANGKGVSRDNEQAIFWYRKAAEQGIRAAKDDLAALTAKLQRWKAEDERLQASVLGLVLSGVRGVRPAANGSATNGPAGIVVGGSEDVNAALHSAVSGMLGKPLSASGMANLGAAVTGMVVAANSGKKQGLSDEAIIANIEAEKRKAEEQSRLQNSGGAFTRMLHGGGFPTMEEFANPSPETLLESAALVIGGLKAGRDALRNREPREQKCLTCGETFTAYTNDITGFFPSYCSKECSDAGMRNDQLRRIEETREDIAKNLKRNEDMQNSIFTNDKIKREHAEKTLEKHLELVKKHNEEVKEFNNSLNR